MYTAVYMGPTRAAVSTAVYGLVRSLLGGVRFYTGRVQASKARLVLVDGRVVYTDPRNTGRVVVYSIRTV